MRSRADEGHVAPYHVEELRKLIDVPVTQPGSYTGDAGIVLLRLTDQLSVLERPHRAEFDDSEGLLIESVAVLQEEYGPRTVELDQQRDHHEHRGEQQQTDGRE